MGPPLLSYSSTSKASLAYNHEMKGVQLVVDKDYSPGVRDRVDVFNNERGPIFMTGRIYYYSFWSQYDISQS
jgi:hypothetical protein